MLLAYLIGAIPFAIVIGLGIFKVDVRKHGSGNTGATNCVRVLGWKVGIPVFLLDTFKGTIAVLMGAWAFRALGYTNADLCYQVTLTLIMIAAICGHVYSPFLHFKGGKGVAATLGTSLALVPWAALCALGCFLVIAVICKYVSVASMIAGVLLAVFSALLYPQYVPYILGCAFIALFVIFNHRSNISRLRNGVEPKFKAAHRNDPPDAYEQDTASILEEAAKKGE